MGELRAEALTVIAESSTLVDGVNLSVTPGELVVLIGPNGAGKSSLVKCLAGFEKATSGMVYLDDRPLAAFSPSSRARAISYLPQIRSLAWPLTVRDTVALARFAYGGMLGRPSARDMAAVDIAMAQVDMTEFADRRTDSLSGGELARVHLARCFAAQTPMLIADEPLAALDPSHQWQIMTLLRRFVEQGNGALVILHDLQMAARFADRIVWMKEGRIRADGSALETMTEARIADIYGIKAHIDNHQDYPLLSITGRI